MDPVLKTRLVGASVVILLAVIFLPMILGSGSPDQPQTSEIQLTDKQSYQLPNLASESDNSAPVNAADKLASLSDQLSDADVPFRPVEIPSSAVSEITTPEIVAEKPKPAIVALETAPDIVSTPVYIEPESATPSGDYAVQVGSFGDRNRAVVLKDKLKSAGYPAFIESSDSGSGSMHRVKTGPVASREEGSSLLKLMQQDGLVAQGIIVSQAK